MIVRYRIQTDDFLAEFNDYGSDGLAHMYRPNGELISSTPCNAQIMWLRMNRLRQHMSSTDIEYTITQEILCDD